MTSVTEKKIVTLRPGNEDDGGTEDISESLLHSEQGQESEKFSGALTITSIARPLK